MKRYCTLFIIVVIFLAACAIDTEHNDAIDHDTKGASDVTVKDVKLTGLESSLLNLIGEFPTIVALHIENETAKEIELTVDLYKEGKLQGTQLYFTADLNDIDYRKPVHIVVARNTLNDNQQWVASVITENSTSSIQTDFEQSPTYSSATFDGISTPFSALLGEKKIIGTTLMYPEDDLSESTSIDSEEDLLEASKNGLIYAYYLLVK